MRFQMRFGGRLRRRATAPLFFVVAAFASIDPAAAQDATWVGGTPSAANSDYFATTNWTPAGAPTGTATFNASANTNISIGSVSSIGGWTFGPGASAYTFTIDVPGAVQFNGAGITINGGSASITNNLSLEFHNSSTAGAASIANNFSLLFFDSSNAGNADITTTRAVQFFNNSSPGAAAITGVGALANVHFESTSGPNNDHKLTVGSLAGSGTFSLGQNQLTVGSNNLSTTVDGVIIDGVVAGGSLVKVGTGTLTLSGINAYTGGTTISAGIVQVTNSSSVGSGAVTLDGGTFQADGLSDLAFTNQVKVNSTGGTIDNNSTVLTMSGVISNGTGGPGLLQLTNASGGFGTTVLSGVNTYSGGTRVVDTVLQVTNNASVGTGMVTLENASFVADGLSDLTFTNNFRINNTIAGSAIDANGVTLTIAGNISDGNGAGKLAVMDSSGGGGATVLLGTNTYSGGTTICNCATLQLGDATHTASIIGDVTNEGQFFIVNANTSGITSITNDGIFSSALTIFMNATSASSIAITNTNGGATFFGTPGGTDTATAANATIDNNNGGVTTFQAQTTAGAAQITNQTGGATAFMDQSSAGSATIINLNLGTTVFGTAFGSDAPTAGNANIINNSFGLTEFNASSTAGNATITTNNNGVTNFFDNSTAGNATIITLSGGETNFFDKANGGTAQFITAGTGFVDFGGTAGPNNDGRITAGSIAGSGNYFIGGGNTLVVGGNNLSTTVSGVIADFNPCGCGPVGAGSLEKAGIGTLTLSGTNTYTGTTDVNGGVLRVDGSIELSSQTTVNANAVLTGIGTVGNTTIATGGTFAPGSTTPGTFMTVAGNLAFQSGALYLVQLDPSTSTMAKVTGTAALTGAAGAAFLSGNYVAKQYTILTATGGVSGTFGTFDTLNKPANVKASLSYDANNVYLDLALAFVVPGGLNVNQQNVANTLTNFFNTTGGIPAAFASLTPAGLTQVSGELATGSQQATFDAMNLFLSLISDPFVAGRNGGFGDNAGAVPFADESALGYAVKKPAAARDAFAKFPTKADVARSDLFDQRWSVWGAAYGGGSTTSGNAALGSNDASARAFGFAVGADYRLSPDTLAGFALAGGGTNFSVSGFGSGRSDLFQAGAFVRHNMGAAYITAAAAYGWQDVTTERTVTVAGFERLRAQFNANAYSGRIEGGYRYVTPWMGITPYAAGQFTTYSLPAYAEQVLAGAGTFALNYAAKDVTAARTELGVRTDKSFAVSNGILTLRGRAAWAHDFNTDRSVTALFQTLPGAAFVVNGAAQAHESALVTGAAEMKWLNGWSAAAIFEGQFSNVTNSYAGKGVVRYAW